jgi:hypothetical protein
VFFTFLALVEKLLIPVTPEIPSVIPLRDFFIFLFQAAVFATPNLLSKAFKAFNFNPSFSFTKFGFSSG